MREWRARDYLMESRGEAERLETKTNPASAREQLDLAGLGRGMSALDVGCGTGAVTRVMAELTGDGRVVGVDTSEDRLSVARRIAAEAQLDIEFLHADATKAESLPCGFDFVWSRFLLEYLGAPQLALREMVNAARPGGIVAVADLDAQLENFYPLEEETGRLLADVLGHLRQMGLDTHVGRKLFAWCREVGLTDIAVHVMPHQVFAGHLPDSEVHNWTQKLDTVMPIMSERTADDERWEHAREAFLEALTSADLFYYSALVMVTGRSPLEAAGRTQ